MTSELTLSTPVAYALAYALMGWHVLPLEPRAKQPLGRLVPRGMHDATTDAATISAWWARAPHAGVGIALAQSGLVAVDVDPRNGGTETFEQLQAAHGSLRSDVMAFTGGGGEHHVFLVPNGAALSLPGTLGPGVDLKANGYIVVEPSVHPSGRAYGWEASSSPLDGVVPSPLPDWLRSLRVDLQSPAPKVGDVPVDPRMARDLREALYTLDADDHGTWAYCGMALHSTGWGHPAYAMWCGWAQQSSKFDATDSRKRWESFHTDGVRSLRPSFIFAQAQQRGWVNPMARLSVAPAAANEEQAGGLPILDLDQLRAASASITWSVKGVVPADSIGVLFGGSGTFKSFIALDYCLHVAHGLPWLGRKTKKGAVLFIAAEGGAGLWRRVQAWHQARGLSCDGVPLYVLPVAVSLTTEASAVVSAAQALGIEPSVIVVDTMSQTFDGEENSANEVAGYLRALGAHFRALWRCVVMVIHHSGHSATERPRGSSALRSNVDFMLGVFRDEKEMLATVECHKQKDGELFEPATFQLSSERLGHDEDGDAITSLVARRVGSADELLAAVQKEGAAGRGGRNQVLLSLLQNGMAERELRKAFYEDAGISEPEARKKAFYRARDWAVSNGFIELIQGTVIVLKEVS